MLHSIVVLLALMPPSESFYFTTDFVLFNFSSRTYALSTFLVDGINSQHICSSMDSKLSFARLETTDESLILARIAMETQTDLLIANKPGEKVRTGFPWVPYEWKFESKSLEHGEYAIIERCSGRLVPVTGFHVSRIVCKTARSTYLHPKNNTIVPPSTDLVLPPPRTKFQVNQIFQRGTYAYMFEKRMIYGDQQEALCAEKGADPVVIDNDDLNGFIFDIVKSYGSNFFIGVVYDASLSDYVYLKSRERLNYHQIGDDYCLKNSFMYPNMEMSNCDGKWSPANKYEQKFYICQRKLTWSDFHTKGNMTTVFLIFLSLSSLTSAILIGFTLWYKISLRQNNQPY